MEAFLLKIKFPLTVGYGMTECGPLISYTPSAHFIAGSVGQTLPEIMHSRLSFPEGHETPMTMVSDGREMPVGEICVRGENVMMGYYKNPDATAAAIDAEGWLHTGDMGSITPDGTIFIKGRYKTMILSASGQNIYPEEIEAKINNKPYVGESLVVERGPRLVALIYPDYEAMDAAGLTLDKMQPVMDLVIKEVNASLAPYEQLTSAQIVPVEFEKTPSGRSSATSTNKFLARAIIHPSLFIHQSLKCHFLPYHGSLWTIVAIYAATVLGLAGIIVSENRNPLKSLAWVTVLLTFPIGGLILYIFFGRSIKNTRMISRRKKRALKRLEEKATLRPDGAEPEVVAHSNTKWP